MRRGVGGVWEESGSGGVGGEEEESGRREERGGEGWEEEGLDVGDSNLSPHPLLPPPPLPPPS